MRIWPVIALAACVSSAGAQKITDSAERLAAAYPDHLLKVEGSQIIWRDGTKMEFHHG